MLQADALRWAIVAAAPNSRFPVIWWSVCVFTALSNVWKDCVAWGLLKTKHRHRKRLFFIFVYFILINGQNQHGGTFIFPIKAIFLQFWQCIIKMCSCFYWLCFYVVFRPEWLISFFLWLLVSWLLHLLLRPIIIHHFHCTVNWSSDLRGFLWFHWPLPTAQGVHYRKPRGGKVRILGENKYYGISKSTYLTPLVK